jgi:hypothetical protein
MYAKTVVLPIALFLSLCALVNLACAQKRQSRTKAEPPQTSGPFVLDTQVPTGYKSLCDLKPKASPQTATFGPEAGYSVRPGCTDFDSKPFVPLIVRVRNQSPEKTKFKLPLLSEVTVNTDSGPQPAAAFYVPWGFPSGFATAMEGSIEVEVGSRETVELLYLLPKPAARTKIQIKGYGSFEPKA